MAKAHRKTAATFQPPRTISRADYLRAGGDEWFREAIYTVVQALGRLLACREAFGRTLGLTGSQFAVLMGTAYLQEREGVSIRDLAQHVSLAPTHVTTEVGKLIHKGYLAKQPSPHDGRSVLVSLSPRGEGAIDAVASIVGQTNDILFADIAAQELEAVADVMRRVVVNSERAIGKLRKPQRASSFQRSN